MLEKVALITIIVSGVVYVAKNVTNYIKGIINRKRVETYMREALAIIEDLSAVPTEIKKTKKKGK